KSNEEVAADYEHEKEELRMWLTIVLDEEETVDPKILQDLVDLHRLVMKRFKVTTPKGYNLLLWGDLKVMFETNAEDEIWSNQQDWTLISWKLYESCGVHTLLMDGTLTSFNMLVEKRYPLIKEMLQKMLNWKLEAEAESTMAFELLKFININGLRKAFPVAEGSYRKQLHRGIENDIYSTVDACPNACEMWKAIERLKRVLTSLQPEWQRSQQSTRNRGKTIITSSAPGYDPEPDTVTEDDEISKDKEIDKLMALISLSGTGYDNQRAVNVAGARENVVQADWKDDTNDESEEQELEAHYMYMAQIHEVTPDSVDNSGPIFDDERMHKDDQDDTDDLD
ncbi:hypothetical protein Tco_1100592, partial [Tanacetum coccineum]